MQFDFGKYKGQNVIDVIKNDPFYGNWVANKFREKKPELVEFISKHMDLSSCLVPIGKYRAKSIREIRQSDPKYFQWLINNEWVKEHCPEIMHEVFVKYPATKEHPFGKYVEIDELAI